MYRSLDPGKIVVTAETLGRRVDERFPDSGLSHVIRELTEVARHAEGLALWLQRPNRWLRGGVALAIALIVVLVAGAFLSLDLNVSLFSTMSDFAQGLESVINDFIFLGLAIFFLATGEARLKRRKALVAIHVLRSMAHIIDMHQLTKDPEQFAQTVVLTPSSPKRSMTPYELTRYLDYCSEALAILSKIAAVYVQDFNDPVTLSAVNDVEELTSGLARKIWQKIMILDRVMHEAGEPTIVTNASAR
jgi:type IV secretory pathway VirB2 component (pilin)